MDPIPPETPTLREIEPIGDVILGEIDPRNLTREEFEKSPDLLFHGAKEYFNFSQ